MEQYLKMFSSELQQIQANNRQLYAKIDSAEAMLQQMMRQGEADPYAQPQEQKAAAPQKRQSWSDDEHCKFLQAYFTYTRDQPKLIQQAISTRDIRQVYSHIQKYELKLQQFNQKSTEFAQKHCAFVANHLAACSVSLPARLTPAEMVQLISYPGQFTNACVYFFTCQKALGPQLAERADSILFYNFPQCQRSSLQLVCEAYQAFWMLSRDYLQASGLVLKLIKLLDLFESQSQDSQQFIVLNCSKMLGLEQDETLCLWRCIWVICKAGTFRSQ